MVRAEWLHGRLVMDFLAEWRITPGYTVVFFLDCLNIPTVQVSARGGEGPLGCCKSSIEDWRTALLGLGLPFPRDAEDIILEDLDFV